jgi:outer membrane protein OmpA-like peptidoglycan-associated protein
MNMTSARTIAAGVTVGFAILWLVYAGTVFAQQSRQSVNAIGTKLTADEITDALRPKPKVRGVKLAKENAILTLLTFETGSSELTSSSKMVLQEFGKAAKEGLAGVTITIEGHADKRGSHEYNMDLSRQRAEVVRAYLVRELKVDPKQFKIVAMGFSQPKDPDPTAGINRRVEFVTQNLTN